MKQYYFTDRKGSKYTAIVTSETSCTVTVDVYHSGTLSHIGLKSYKRPIELEVQNIFDFTHNPFLPTSIVHKSKMVIVGESIDLALWQRDAMPDRRVRAKVDKKDVDCTFSLYF